MFTSHTQSSHTSPQLSHPSTAGTFLHPASPSSISPSVGTFTCRQHTHSHVSIVVVTQSTQLHTQGHHQAPSIHAHNCAHIHASHIQHHGITHNTAVGPCQSVIRCTPRCRPIATNCDIDSHTTTGRGLRGKAIPASHGARQLAPTTRQSRPFPWLALHSIAPFQGHNCAIHTGGSIAPPRFSQAIGATRHRTNFSSNNCSNRGGFHSQFGRNIDLQWRHTRGVAPNPSCTKPGPHSF